MANTFTLIASGTVGSGGASSIDFTSIPATFTDLVLKVSARTNRAAVYDSLKITFNGSSSNFTYKELYGAGGSGVGSQDGASNVLGQAVGNNATASTFGNAELYLPNYAGAKNKSYSADNVAEGNTSTVFCSLDAGLWSNTAAITSISILPNVGTGLVQYSTAQLYGIKNS